MEDDEPYTIYPTTGRTLSFPYRTVPRKADCL
jgi:hypothetical protein